MEGQTGPPPTPMNIPHGNPELWSLVLAAGEGSRLAPLTHELYGKALPKQFAALAGDQTLLQETVARLLPVVPSSRTVVVVPAAYGRLAESQLAPFGDADVVRQPRNVGTGPGLLLPLARIRAWAPDATVLVSPSDHHYRAPQHFLDKIPVAIKAAQSSTAGLCLLGVSAEKASTDLGWIVADSPEGARSTGAAVDRFVEKPAAAAAAQLHRQGGIWNTFVMVGSVSAFWKLLEQHLPQQTRLFDDYVAAVGKRNEATVLRRIYDTIAPADFSRDVLAHAPGLRVVSVDGAGWSDLGTPERLMETLAGTPALAALKKRLSARPVSTSRFEALQVRPAV